MTTSPVRVLHIIDDLLGGGSQSHLWDLIRLTDPADVQQQVVTLSTDRGQFIYANRLAAAGVYRTSAVSTRTRRALRPIQSMTTALRPSWMRPLRQLIWRGRLERAAVRLSLRVATFRPHVIFAHQVRALPAALRLKTIWRRPVIYFVPCLISQMHEAGFGWLETLCRERHHEVDLFFTGGAPVSELRALGIPANKIHLNRGRVDLPAMAAATARREHHRAAVRTEIAAAPGCRLILSTGRLHRTKGHDHAIAAMPTILHNIPDAHLAVLGEGDERAALMARARELGVDSRVHLLGYREQPQPYYSAADLYLRTNVLEGDNGCSYMAMAAGLPVVGFDTGSEHSENILAAGHGFLVTTGDAAQLAARAVEILSSTDLGHRLGERGASYAARFDIASNLQIYLDAYRSLRGARA